MLLAAFRAPDHPEYTFRACEAVSGPYSASGEGVSGRCASAVWLPGRRVGEFDLAVSDVLKRFRVGAYAV